LTPTSRRVARAVDLLKATKAESKASSEKELNIELMNKLDQLMVSYGLGVDFLHFVALQAIFTTDYNICKHWAEHEDIFIDLVKREGKVGIEHFMQSLILYFIRVQSKDFLPYASTCLYKLWEHRVLSDKFIIGWAEKEFRLDKDSGLYDKKAEKKFREETEKCIEYLK